MENNKLLIGVQFIDKNSKNAGVIELIVLRDITLHQLLEGIKYGLKNESYKKIYDYCTIEENLNSGNITLTSYDASKVKENIKNKRVILSEKDFQKQLDEIGFITSTRIIFDSTGKYQTHQVNIENIVPAFEVENKSILFPRYNISTRQMYQFDDTAIEILPPSEVPQQPKQNLFFTMLPTVLMVSSTILIKLAVSDGSVMSMIALSSTMGAITIITTSLNHMHQKKEYKKELKNWRETYQTYIKKEINNIEKRQVADAVKLNELYPDIEDIISTFNQGVYDVSKDIFSRAFADKDFLTVRLGISSEISSMFKIQGAEKNVVFSSSNFRDDSGKIHLFTLGDKDYKTTDNTEYYLSNLPNYIANKYKYMTAPLLFSFKNCGALGVVSTNNEKRNFLIERMIFELCFYHSPNNLQFVMMFPPTDDADIIERRIIPYKFLPHFRELLADRSQFIFNTESANAVFSKMLGIMGEREKDKSHLPHIIFIVYDEYDIKEHAFAQYLPEVPEDKYKNSLGLTFIFLESDRKYLPKYCNDIIFVKENGNAEIIPHENETCKKKFSFKQIQEWDKKLYNAYNIISALNYAKISANGKVPSIVSLFELYGLTKNNIDIEKFWEGEHGKRQYNVQNSIAVPIGKTDSGIITLDLHEKYDGPHMLVAGTTGSGKSETIISYLLGLCLCFRPDEVNLMLVDMKGGGFIKHIGSLPHIVGSVTDVDGDENGTGAEYMLKRFLDALTSEIRRRKILFNSMYVDNINDYIKVCKNIEAHIESINNRLKNENRRQLTEEEKYKIRKQAKNEMLPHLVLVIDEFTELKRFSNESDGVDFISEITTIARVGRSLGFHIILISQNIEGAINDDIRVNTKSRLCLKVATKIASKEMIGNDLAASPTMPGNGRGYLLVGTGSRFEYFQSAYSKAKAEENIETSTEIIEASKSGPYRIFYCSDKDNAEYIEKEKRLERQGKLETQLSVIVSAINTYYNSHRYKYNAPHIIFQKPLPERMILKGKEIYSYQDNKFEFMRSV